MPRLSILTAATATAALALAVPTGAMARHGSDDGPGDDHGATAEHVDHHEAGDDDGTDDHVRGTVTSFTGGVLTVTKADGTVLSARVTDASEIRCDHGRHGRDDRRPARTRDCTAAGLVAGAKVRELDIDGTGSAAVVDEMKITH